MSMLCSCGVLLLPQMSKKRFADAGAVRLGRGACGSVLERGTAANPTAAQLWQVMGAACRCGVLAT